jgi:hypothetical protein
MAEIRAAQHDLNVINEYMERAGKANVALTSADINHNINWLLAEAKRERDNEFTAMDEYNRLYSRIPTRQPVIAQINYIRRSSNASAKTECGNRTFDYFTSTCITTNATTTTTTRCTTT